MKQEKDLKLKPEPHHETLALDILMRWTNVYRIETRDDIKEFLFRVAFLMDLDSIGSKIKTGNFLSMYGFREAQYHFTTGILAKYIGYSSEPNEKSFLPRESFFKSTFINGFNAMMKAGQYGIEISVPKDLIKYEGDKKVVSSQADTPEKLAGAEKAAARLMEMIPADAFVNNFDFVKSEMAFQPFEEHLPQIKLPRPTTSDYKRREEIEKGNHEGQSYESAWMEIMNSFDWSHELYADGDLYGLKTALGEVLLPPLFENFTMMTKQELKKGDRVVTQQGGKWGVIIADGTGSWLVKPEYDYIGYPNDVTHVRKNGKWGVLNITKGEYIIEPECEAVYDNSGFLFCNRIGFYKKDGKYGVLADWGVHTDPIFEEVDMEPDGNVKVKFNGQWGFIDEDHKFTADEDEAYYFFDV